ncbi:hypothetical protein TWF173_006941 [Orbilia oligospora]|nr:hypothetical protein TWF173_006941 [Orbilia oligospora]
MRCIKIKLAILWLCLAPGAIATPVVQMRPHEGDDHGHAQGNDSDIVSKPNQTESKIEISENDHSGKNLVEKTINPTIFYSPLYVVCPDPSAIVSMPDDPPNGYPEIDGRQRPRGLDLARATRVRTLCLECFCNQQTGDLAAWNPGRRVCGGPVIFFAQKCQYWFGCFCSTTMFNPPYDPAVNLLDYQHAIDSIPGPVRRLHDGWHWRPDGNIMLTWQDQWIHRGVQILEEWEMAALAPEREETESVSPQLYTADDPKGQPYMWPGGSSNSKFNGGGNGGSAGGAGGAGGGLVSKREEMDQHVKKGVA